VVFLSSSSFFFEEELDFVVFVLSSSFLVDEVLGFVVVTLPWLEDALLPVVVTPAPEVVEVARVVAVEEVAVDEGVGLLPPKLLVFQ
jgi:hypothetical protein